jgi:hypothetical protein
MAYVLGERQPPQLSQVAQEKVTNLVVAHGVVPVGGEALTVLEREQEALHGYLDRLGFDLNRTAPSEAGWPERAVRMGAAFALYAYREAGCVPVIGGDELDISASLAEIEGVPEAYALSTYGDVGLMSLMRVVREQANDFGIRSNVLFGVGGALEMGAGCTRYHLQNALAAAS